MNKLLVLIQCKDEVGLVANISRILAAHKLNIIAMREFVDEEEQRFFARISCSGVVLAKFMRIISPEFVAKYQQKIINIHHSFLPAFIGASPYQQAFKRGVKIIGATAHFVTNDLDEGPIINQQTTEVNHTYGAKQMAIAGREIEKSVLSKALALVFDDRVFVVGNKTVVFD